MRTLLKLAGLCALVLGMAVSCVKPPVSNLTAPIDLTALDITQTSVTLSWGAVEDADTYRVRFNNGQVVTVGINIYQVTGLAPETNYTWAVQAVKGDVLSPWSANAFFTTLPTIIPMPMNLTVSDITYESALLGWDGVEGATGYEVRVGNAVPVRVAVEELTYALNQLDPETEYVCRVRTVKEDRVSEWATVSFTTLPLPPVGIPQNLVATDITCYSAVLSWDAVERASGYRVSIDGREIAVTAPTCTVIALHPETEYAWSVRTVEGQRLGDWASEVSFTTTVEPVIEFTVPYSGTFYGEYFGPGTSNFTLTFRTENPLTNGWSAGLETVFPPVDMYPSNEYLDFPEGVYNFSSVRGEMNTIWTGTTLTSLRRYDNGTNMYDLEILGGTLTITGNHANYHIEWDVEVEGRPNFKAVYDGEFLIRNPNYVPPSGVVHDLGRIPMRGNQVTYFPGAFDGLSDGYIIQGVEDGVTFVDNTPVGTGWYVANVQFHAPLGSGTMIPNGDYVIDRSNDPGTVLSGITPNGTARGLWAYRLDNDVVSSVAIEFGSVSVNFVDNTYDITFAAYAANGDYYMGAIFSTYYDPGDPGTMGAPGRPYLLQRATPWTYLRSDKPAN